MFIDEKIENKIQNINKSLTSEDIKALLSYYFRIKRGYKGVLSEFYSYHFHEVDDFVAFNEEEIITIEIKISKNDFLADFKKKKHKYLFEATKHEKYNSKKGVNNFYKDYFYFNRFFFCVSRDLEDFAKNYIRKNANYAGLLVVCNDNIVCVKKAMLLKPKVHNYQYYINSQDNLNLLESFITRMSSEITKLRNKKD